MSDKPKDLTAAAEAGWSEFSPVQQAYIERKLELERERCAQALKEMAELSAGERERALLDAIAAIRALKEGP